MYPNITITHLDLTETAMELVYAIGVPWGSFIVAILYIVVTYSFSKKPEPQPSSSQDSHITKASQSKNASSHSLKTISRSMGQGRPKIRKDEKG